MDANVKCIYIKGVCTKNIYIESTYTKDVCIKNSCLGAAGVNVVCVKGICNSNTYIRDSCTVIAFSIIDAYIKGTSPKDICSSA